MGIWPFKNKVSTIEDSGLLKGLTDWHSHILPGVDDGFKEMEDSLAALKQLERLGVKTLWLTPHIMEDYPNETKELRKKFEELKKEYNGCIDLNLAAEHMLDSLFEERLENNDLLPLGKSGKFILVETSYFNPPMNMVGLLEQIQHKGYFPVLAHPERYVYMDEKDYQRLRDINVSYQANYFSLIGAYGETARKKLEWMLKKDMIDVMGSDIHRLSVLEKLIKKSPKSAKSLELLKEVSQKNHALYN